MGVAPVHYDVEQIERESRAMIIKSINDAKAIRVKDGKDTIYLDLQAIVMEVNVAAAVAIVKAINADFGADMLAHSIGNALGNIVGNFKNNFGDDDDLMQCLFEGLTEAMSSVLDGSPSRENSRLTRQTFTGQTGGRA